MDDRPSRSLSSGPSLRESFRALHVPPSGNFFRKLLAFAGPGFLVSVGYMDPGNWATDLGGGSAFGYRLLFVVMLSNLVAILLQGLSLKLGVATGEDLAQACRSQYSRPVSISLWVLAELAIAACDLAEVIGSAIGLQLLFGVPLVAGVCITALDVLLILFLQHRGYRYLEAFVIALVAIISVCFGAEIIFSHPDARLILHGMFLPSRPLITDRAMLYIGLGIFGATVMPNNLYLHSSLVQTRDFDLTSAGKREAIRFFQIDSAFALMLAFFVNAAILIVAAAVFHNSGNTQVAEIGDAYKLLSPLLGVGAASTIFAIALLASGQNSTLTGTLAGQIVMEGFLQLRMRPWLRRMITRAFAIVPAVIAAAIYGSSGTARLLVFSQVVLSMQLSFAVFPLVQFTGNKKMMKEFVNPLWLKLLAWATAITIAALNVWLLVQLIWHMA